MTDSTSGAGQPVASVADSAGSTDALTFQPDDPGDDLAAELDDADPAEFADVDDDEDDDAEIITGVCRGGPYDGRTATCRFPRGFLLVHRPRDLVWIYDYSADSGEFTIRGDAMPLDEEKRWKVADEGDYDIIAYDDGPVPR
jgi:hypothetical protein